MSKHTKKSKLTKKSLNERSKRLLKIPVISFIAKNIRPPQVYWLTFALILILKCCYYHFNYFMIVDDWFLYGGNGLVRNAWSEIIAPTGVIFFRPLACLIDSYIIGPIAGHMWIVYFLITAMFGLSLYFFSKVLNKLNIAAGALFLIIFGFTPLGTEATYWVAASSRIITSLFLTSLSGFFLNKFLERDNWKWLCLTLFAISGLASLCFYESTIPISLAYTFTIILFHPRIKEKWYNWLLSLLLTLSNLLLIAWYYIAFQSSEALARGTVIWETENPLGQIRTILVSYFHVFTRIHTDIIVRGWQTGLNTIMQNGSFLFLIAAAFFAVLFGRLSAQNLERKSLIKSLIVSIILIIAGNILNFIIIMGEIPLRLAFFTLFGIAIFADALLSRLNKHIYSTIVAILAFTFIIVNVGELTDYKNTSQKDTQIAQQIINTVPEHILNPEVAVIVFNAPLSYWREPYATHIQAATQNYATMTGAVRTALNDHYVDNLATLRHGQHTYWPYGMHTIAPVWLNDELLIETVTLEEADDHLSYYLMLEDTAADRGSADRRSGGRRPVGKLQYLGDYWYEYINL